MGGNGMSRLFISYSNSMGPNLINLKDFAAIVVGRIDGGLDGSLGSLGNVPSVPRFHERFINHVECDIAGAC
jgi:hypothetical protein